MLAALKTKYAEKVEEVSPRPVVPPVRQAAISDDKEPEGLHLTQSPVLD